MSWFQYIFVIIFSVHCGFLLSAVFNVRIRRIKVEDALYYGKLIKWTTVLLCLTYYVLIYFAVFETTKKLDAHIIFIFLTFLLGLFLLIMEIFFSRYFFDEEKISVIRLCRKNFSVKWSFVKTIVESDYLYCYRVTSIENRKINLSYFLKNIDDFADYAETEKTNNRQADV